MAVSDAQPAVAGHTAEVTKRQQPDRVCVLPSDPSWIQEAGYLEESLGLLGRAAEVTEAGDDGHRYVLPGLTYRIAERALGRITDEVREGGRPTLHLIVVEAFGLDALWEVLGVLRRARDGEEAAAEVAGLLEDLSPSRTTAAFVADLEKVLAVLTLDIPAGRSIATAFVQEYMPGFDFDAAYEQLATAWKAAGIKP